MAIQKLKITRENDKVWRVLTALDAHVGNLKLINGVWKFKAIGYDDTGAVLPGGGPLTERHNTILAVLSDEAVNAAFGDCF